MANRALVLTAIVLAGCGAGDKRPVPVQPMLPSDVAQRLSAQSDEVAAAFEAGDTCGARDKAVRLQRDTIEAINKRRVPPAFREQLLAAVNDLVGRIECVPPDEDDENRGKRGKRRGKGKGGKDD